MNMPTTRIAYRYHFKLGNKIVHTGTTYDIGRQERDHRKKAGWGKGHIKQIGLRTTSRSGYSVGAGTKRQRKAGVWSLRESSVEFNRKDATAYHHRAACKAYFGGYEGCHAGLR